MADYKLAWDQDTERLYETGVKHGVLFPKTGTNGAYTAGVVWNGLTSVNENPTGAEANPIYADDIKYLNLVSVEEFEGTINAYTYPDEFMQCDGSLGVLDGVYIGQQTRREFGFCYTTTIGNDAEGTDYGEKLHIVYGALASPSSKEYSTISDDPEAIEFSWDFTTTPVEVVYDDVTYKPTATLVIDSTKVDETKYKALKQILYGTAATTSPEAAAIDARLPLPAEVFSTLAS